MPLSCLTRYFAGETRDSMPHNEDRLGQMGNTRSVQTGFQTHTLWILLRRDPDQAHWNFARDGLRSEKETCES